MWDNEWHGVIFNGAYMNISEGQDQSIPCLDNSCACGGAHAWMGMPWEEHWYWRRERCDSDERIFVVGKVVDGIRTEYPVICHGLRGIEAHKCSAGGVLRGIRIRSSCIFLLVSTTVGVLQSGGVSYL